VDVLALAGAAAQKPSSLEAESGQCSHLVAASEAARQTVAHVLLPQRGVRVCGGEQQPPLPCELWHRARGHVGAQPRLQLLQLRSVCGFVGLA